MKLIVGLGNPGEKYEKTRHNLGFAVVEKLAKEMINGQWLMVDKFQSLIIKHQSSTILAKPQTMMNASGVAVGKIASFYKILPGDIWVVHDDVDLLLGKIKIVVGRGAAGHRGVESIIKILGTEEFVRFRCGIMAGEMPIEKRKHVDAERFVLRPFEPREKAIVKRMIKKTVEAVGVGLVESLSVAMNRYN
jgi:PTH1 family peptidyl-tRNA hydrolase